MKAFKRMVSWLVVLTMMTAGAATLAEEATETASAPVAVVSTVVEKEAALKAEAPVEKAAPKTEKEAHKAEAPAEKEVASKAEAPVEKEAPKAEAPVAEAAPKAETSIVEEALKAVTPVAEEAAPKTETPVAEEVAPKTETPVVVEASEADYSVVEEAFKADDTLAVKEAPEAETSKEKTAEPQTASAVDVNEAVPATAVTVEKTNSQDSEKAEKELSESEKELEKFLETMNEECSKVDLLKGTKEQGHKMIDQMNGLGNEEKELLKKYFDTSVSSASGSLLGIPGMGVMTKLNKAQLEMLKAKKTSGDESAKHMAKAMKLIMEAGLSLVPGGSYVSTAKSFAESTIDYVKSKVVNNYMDQPGHIIGDMKIVVNNVVDNVKNTIKSIWPF